MANDRDLLDVELVLDSPAGPRRISVGHIPVVVGKGEHSHLRIPAASGDVPELAVWQQNHQVMLRAVPGPVAINGRQWTWAILDDGDEISIGGLLINVVIATQPDRSAIQAQDERRTFVRLPVDAQGWLVDHPGATDQRASVVQVADLSDGGAQVLTSVELQPDEQITVEVELPPDGRHSRIRLRVHSVQPVHSSTFHFSAHCSLDQTQGPEGPHATTGDTNREIQ